MDAIASFSLRDHQAALWYLGQAGYIFRAAGKLVTIDPYLSDSAAGGVAGFKRLVPIPIQPEQLQVDLFIVTHDHLDHLDPETIRRYGHKDSTAFVAPRLAARKLAELGVPHQAIHVVDTGGRAVIADVTVEGVFALPTSPGVLDTTGYKLTFANGRSVYHASDTGFTPLLLDAAPKGVEVLLVPINGKWGNLSVEQAVELAAAVKPRFALPNHYDMMPLNAENPDTFRWLFEARKLAGCCVIPTIMKPFVWE
jgi:L-ascorbate 6-phosphate lactonase